jgi:hypothetical protein
MSSDRSSENYPTVQICDQCVEADEKQRENAQIVNVEEYDPSYGDTCEFCDKTYEEELQET